MKRRMKSLLLCAMMLLTGCVSYTPETKFNRERWEKREDWDFSLRDDIVSDLMHHHQLKGLSYKQLTDSIGDPSYSDSDGVSYQVKMDFESDIDPVYSKYLVIKLNKDSVVTGFSIKESKTDN